LIKLASLAITCPVNTAGCERGFSVQNQILVPLRNRLTPVKISAPPADTFNFERALELWKLAKKRKLLANKHTE